MRYIVEVCDVCGKEFYGMPINNHGSYEYIRHTNFSNNINVMFYRTKDIPRNKRAVAIAKEFFIDGNDKIKKDEAIEFLKCLKHYNYSDKELLEEVFQEIQNLIGKIK